MKYLTHRKISVSLLLAALLALPTACTHTTTTSATTKDPVSPSESTGSVQVAPSTQTFSDPVIARIRDEGLNHSQVMETLNVLTNVIGQRLTNSPNQRKAAAWVRDQLTSWGLVNALLEPWGPFGTGWEVKRFSIQALEPTHFALIGYPKAWSPALPAPVEAEVIHLDATNEAGLEKYKGKLAGKIVMIGAIRKLEARFEPLATRVTDAELEKMDESNKPVEVPQEGRRDTASERRARFRASSAQGEALTTSRPAAQNPAPTSRPGRGGRGGNFQFSSKALGFAKDEGAALVITPSTIGDGGTFFTAQASVPGESPFGGSTTRPKIYSKEPPANIPQVTLSAEDYNRLARMIAHGQTPKIAATLEVAFYSDDLNPPNVSAEIPGTDPVLKNEIVMVGGHMDSWQSGTGTTDNGAGSACALEAVRILKALNLQPRRTIRVALWSGEEQGIYGSEAYVKQHFAHFPELPETPTPPSTQPATEPTSRPARRTRHASELVTLPEYEKLSAYFNLDNGTGKIRGIYTQGNTAAVPYFRAWLKDFHDLGAKTVTLNNTGGTDHLSFDAVGLPGFQFIQDEIDYGTRTHHSNEDVYDRAQQADLEQAATIMAAFLWHTANLEERFPRKPLAP